MSPRGKAEFLLFWMTFIWAGTFVVAKLGLEEISPVLLVALRFSLAAALLLLLGFRRILRIDRPVFWRGLVLGGLLYLGFVFQTVGLEFTTASKSAFITGLMVVFTPFFQIVIAGRFPKAGNFIGVAIVTAGLWLLTLPVAGGGSSGEAAGFNRGDALTLAGAAVFGLYIVMLGLYSKGRDAVALTFLQMIVPAALGWAGAFLLETPVWRPSLPGIAGLLYLAFLGNLLALYIQTRFQPDTTPTRAVIIFTIEPLWAALMGYGFLGERMGTWGWMGGALIIAGIIVSEFSDGRSRKPG